MSLRRMQEVDQRQGRRDNLALFFKVHMQMIQRLRVQRCRILRHLLLLLLLLLLMLLLLLLLFLLLRIVAVVEP